MDAIHWVFAALLGLSLAASTGLNTFLPLALLSAAAKWHVAGVQLSGPFAWLGSDAALIALGIATVIEVVGDKIPAVDHALDSFGTFIRPIVGSAAFAAALGHADPVTASIIGLIVGGTTTFGVHAAKSGTRVASTASTMGCANPLISVAEDTAALGITATGLFLPLLVPVALAGLVWVVVGAVKWVKSANRPKV
jgi:hypothetical protein